VRRPHEDPTPRSFSFLAEPSRRRSFPCFPSRIAARALPPSVIWPLPLFFLLLRARRSTEPSSVPGHPSRRRTVPSPKLSAAGRRSSSICPAVASPLSFSSCGVP
jgi:hypothetical protein